MWEWWVGRTGEVFAWWVCGSFHALRTRFSTHPPSLAKIRTIFWSALYAYPIAWVIIMLLALAQPSWLVLLSVCLAFALANLWGYLRCSRDQKKRMQDWVAENTIAATLGGGVNRFLAK